jgi:hypothetical protein
MEKLRKAESVTVDRDCGGRAKTKPRQRARWQCTAHRHVSASLSAANNMLKLQMNHPPAAGVAFLDSHKPKHYGPRGFKEGRNHLILLATPQCRTKGR